jgi:endonuclease-3
MARAERPKKTARTTDSARRTRVAKIVRKLASEYPDVRLALEFEGPLDLLISLILAAQCTDARVNVVMGQLRHRYPTAEAWAGLDRSDLEAEIRSTGFYRNKAKAIQGCASALVERFDGRIPDRLEDLLTLPGVGRKTANILRGNAFGQPAIGVDTHVGRLARRLGLSAETDPDKVEADLTAVVRSRDRVRFCQRVQNHGRLVCVARKPRCEACAIADLCPRVGVV